MKPASAEKALPGFRSQSPSRDLTAGRCSVLTNIFRIAEGRPQRLDDPDPSSSLLGQVTNLGVGLQGRRLGGRTDGVGDESSIVSLLGKTGSQGPCILAEILELAQAGRSALDLNGEGLGGVFKNTFDALSDWDKLLTGLDSSCRSRSRICHDSQGTNEVDEAGNLEYCGGLHCGWWDVFSLLHVSA